jgi:hypothetical protein
MDVIWGTLLFAGKWLFIALIYLVLFMVVIAVRREISLHLTGEMPAPALAAGRLKIIKSGRDPRAKPGAILPLPNEATLGSDRANDLVLGDQFVSSRHARLRWDGATWWLEDLGSKNGTFVNGRQAPPHREQPIPFGATLLIGDMALELLE